ncbi:MAG TPA: SpoIIE family protein phosphatase [Ilumatobacter sp.]|jgi:sigma-B regulation protein RsbU (phosphoserine phosphatase)|nr:SpoIIE family protein phosphatase [Ilumatobacter sp.]
MERRYEHAACGLLTTGADGTILSVNHTFLSWLGAERSDLVDRRTFADLLTGGGRIYYETHYAPMLAMQGSAREIAFDLLGSGGRRLSVLVNARAEVVDGDRVIHVAVFDATERRMYERELLAAKERAERSEAQSQVLARTLQETLLPHRLPTIPGLDVAGVYLAAGAGHEIGGDFYDVFQVRPDDWIIALGDVEGKGVDAAVVTALVRYSIRAAAVEHEPSGVLRIVNEILLRDDTPRFCTAVVLRCRRNRGNWRITISCGGHPPPILATKDAVDLVGRPGSLLGVFPDVEFHDVDIHLDEITLVVAYTDGVSEARRNREQFGEERILELVGRFSDHPVDGVLKHLVDAVLEFGGRPNYDDIAAIAIRPASKEVRRAND